MEDMGHIMGHIGGIGDIMGDSEDIMGDIEDMGDIGDIQECILYGLWSCNLSGCATCFFSKHVSYTLHQQAIYFKFLLCQLDFVRQK